MRTVTIVGVMGLAGILALGAVQPSPRVAEGKTERPDPDTLVDRTMRVPAADLGIWDPINVNVNPVPWRVSGPADADGVRPSQFRHQALGACVQVEGIAWGYDVKTEAPRSRILFDGGVVLIKGADLNRPEVHGKLVRAVGTLRREFFKSHPGFDRQFPEYYFIDVTTFEIIDAVTSPEIVRLKL